MRQDESDFTRALRFTVEQTTRELQNRNRELEILTENIPGGVYRCAHDDAFTVISLSGGFLSMFGYTREDITSIYGNSITNMIYPADRPGVEAVMHHQLSLGSTVECEYRVICKDGSLMWVLDRGRLVPDADGIESFYCVMVDITCRRIEQEKLRLLLERHRVIMNQTTDIIFELDIAKDTIDFSPNWEKRFGYRAISSNISRDIPHSTNIHPDDIPRYVKLLHNITSGVPYSETEFRIRNITYQYTWCRIRSTTQYDSDDIPIKAIGVIVDIDEEKCRSTALIEAAQRDALTKLFNKDATKLKIEHLLSDKSDNRLHAMMIIDVDNFKAVNDRFGHQWGDAVLSKMAKSLKNLFRSTDIIGRIGGDEFLVFMENIGTPELASRKARALVQIFKGTPLKINIELSCSVGVAFYPKDAMDYTGLFINADSALYRVKNSGKENFAFFEESMRQDLPNPFIRATLS